MTPSVSVLTGFWLRFHFSNVEYFFQELNSKKLLSKFRKRKRKSPSFVHVLHKTWNWEVSRRSRTTIDGKEMNKVIAFLPFSLPSPSSLLKLPNFFLKPLKESPLKNLKVLGRILGNPLYRRESKIAAMYFSQTSLFLFILTEDLVVSLAAVFWMSRNAP